MKALSKISKLVCFISVLFFGLNVSAQSIGDFDEKVRPLRIGVKIGFPNIVGGNVEYVTPLFNNRLAANVEYSNINFGFLSEFLSDDVEEDNDSQDPDVKFSYFEGGLNYYLFKPGKGLYIGASYSSFNFDATIYDYQPEMYGDVQSYEGTANIDFKHDSFNLKLGAKLGGLFYFRPEIGYAFSSYPEYLEYEFTYEGETRTESESFDELFAADESPQKLLFDGLIFNIGFGFSF